MKKETLQWILYNIVVCFAIYWLSNVILWYPWSINETLGQIIMLTVNPLLWGYASYICIIRYPKEKLFNGVLLNSLLFIIEAIVSDLIFFGAIRKAMDKLMEPTTIYGWGFVLIFPFLIYLIFKKLIVKNKKALITRDFRIPLILGLISLLVIIILLVFDIIFSRFS